LFFLVLALFLSWNCSTVKAQNKAQLKQSKSLAKEKKLSKTDQISARERDEKIRTQYNKRMLKVRRNKKHFGNANSKRYFNTKRTKISRSKVSRDTTTSSAKRKRSGWY
jgi:hypothetical protein